MDIAIANRPFGLMATRIELTATLGSPLGASVI